MVFPVAHEVPGHPRAHQLRSRVLPLALNVSHRAPVAVGRADGQLCLLLEAKPGQVLARALAEGLRLLWRINRSDAHLDLLVRLCRIVGRAAGGERVAVTDADDEAKDGGDRHYGIYERRAATSFCSPSSRSASLITV